MTAHKGGAMNTEAIETIKHLEEWILSHVHLDTANAFYAYALDQLVADWAYWQEAGWSKLYDHFMVNK